MTNCEKFFKRWEYQTTRPASWEPYLQVRKQQLEQDMEQQTGSKLGKKYVEAVYCHPVHLTYMQSTWYKMLGCMKHKMEPRLLGKISITSDYWGYYWGYEDDTTLMAESEEELKTLLTKVKEESGKVGLEFNIQKIKIMASSPITSSEIDEETMETVREFIFLSPQITEDGDCSHDFKKHLLLGKNLWAA